MQADGVPEPRLATVMPWEFRPGVMLPVSSLALGTLVALALFGGFLLFHWVLGYPITAPDASLTESARSSLYAVILVGYVFAALRFGSMGIEGDMRRAVASSPWEYGAFPLETVRRSRFVGVSSVLAGVALITGVARTRGEAMTAPWSSLHDGSYFVWLLLLVCWLVGRAAFFTIQGSRVAAGLGSEEIEVDLLDTQPLLAFGRIGLRFALLWILGGTIAAPLLLGPTLEVGVLLVAGAFVSAIALLALLVPVLGVRRRIRAEKLLEIARLARAIAGDEGALAGTRLAGRRREPDLADLVAYRGLVESVREWPFDSSTLSRFGLYLLIPLGSWIAAALVERGVDAALP